MKTKPAFKKIGLTASVWLFIAFVALLNLGAEGVVQTNVPALKDVFKNDFTIGCLLSYTHVGLPDDPQVPGQATVSVPQGGALIKYHMNGMSPGNMMKAIMTIDTNASKTAVETAAADKKDYAETHPVISFNGNLIAQLNWAKRQGFTFRGHTLVWHSQTPGQFFNKGYLNGGEKVGKEVMLKRLEFYIAEVIRLLHEGWPGLLTAMDVVNEAIDDATGTLRTGKNDWYAIFGDDSYIMKAFEFARKYTKQYGETQMKLYYNDYATANPVKADGIVKLCGPIFKAGFLDGIGMQEHDWSNRPSADEWVASYNKFAPICKEMAVTELDVNTGSSAPDADMLATQANQYAMLFKLFLERSAKSGRGKIVNVSKDGLNDQYTFKPNQSSSLWDANFQCKPAFYAVVDMAKNYKELSALIAAGKKLKQKDFPAADWQAVGQALKAAQEALDKNYSMSESAVTGLGDALQVLKTAMKVK
jgi:endo-1,4-beta-xylanase